MATTKTVKVTNSKVLSYDISAPGYKTVHGSKQILDDTVINVNMIKSETDRSVYTIGDRLGGVATFVTYYTDAAGQKYAVFVADAKYRIGNCTWGRNEAEGLPRYETCPNTEALSNLSATYMTQFILDNYYYANMTTDPYPAFKAVRDSVSIPTLGLNGLASVANCFEVQKIFDNRVILDSFDPTLDNYTMNALTTWNMAGSSSNYVWCSNPYNNNRAWRLHSNGGWSYGGGWNDYGDRDGYRYGFLPVFEIPVNN